MRCPCLGLLLPNPRGAPAWATVSAAFVSPIPPLFVHTNKKSCCSKAAPGPQAVIRPITGPPVQLYLPKGCGGVPRASGFHAELLEGVFERPPHGWLWVSPHVPCHRISCMKLVGIITPTLLIHAEQGFSSHLLQNEVVYGTGGTVPTVPF